MFSPLAHRGYRKLFTAQVIALVGTGLTTVALALLAYSLAGEHAGAVLGTALALKMVAYVVIAPIAGGLAHRLPRKKLLIGLDLARAGVVLCLPFVDSLWQIYALVFVINGCSAAFTPLFQATIPDLLDDEATYTRALSLSRLAYDLESLLSPILAAMALGFLSYDRLFQANGLAFAASALLVLLTVIPPAGPTDRDRSIWGNISFGITAYLKTPRLRGLFALSWAVAAASSSVIVNTVVVAQDVLGLNDDQTALLYAAAGLGSMGVAILLPRWLDHWSERTVMACGGLTLVCGLALAAVFVGAAGPSALLLGACWLTLGAGLALTQTPGGRLLRRSSQGGDRSAYFSAQFALSHGCWLVCYPLAGWIGSVGGLSLSFALMAGLASLGLLVALWIWPRHDPVDLVHVHPAIEHSHPHRHDAHHTHSHDDPLISGHGHHSHASADTHSHWHRHPEVVHRHAFVIDSHHPIWPD